MRRIDKHVRAKDAIREWLRDFSGLRELQDIKDKLLALGDNPKWEDVRKFLSEDRTDIPICDECDKQSNEWEVLELDVKIEGFAGDYSHIHICLPCLVKGMMLLDS